VHKLKQKLEKLRGEIDWTFLKRAKSELAVKKGANLAQI